MSIRIYYDETGYRYKGWRKLSATIKSIVSESSAVDGEINVIITGDEKLLDINIRFLEHDYYTDVITFNYNTGNTINGEIYISLDTVRRNAINYNVSLNNEMTRVIIHGVLHLTGYDDRNDEERKRMREMEDMWIERTGGM